MTISAIGDINHSSVDIKLKTFELRESTIDSEGFKGGTRGAPIMPRDAVSRTANVERTGRPNKSKNKSSIDIKVKTFELRINGIFYFIFIIV